jgi:alpha-glucosidase
MPAAFDLYEKVGVRQVKTGYVADAGDIRRVTDDGVEVHEWHDGQFTVNHHERLLREAAKRRISINTHEPVKDTGLRRTYPNWLSREGARGQEYNAWGTPPNPPEHVAMLPFTRMLSGPMDYTPGIVALDGYAVGNRVQHTLAKELSLYVVLYSPVQMAADLPENYDKHPDAFQFIKDVPVDWDESIGLAGEVGDFVAIARKQRGAPDWFLGALTDEHPRQLALKLDFLDPGARYVAEIYRDGPEADWETRPYDLVVEKREVTAADTLDLRLAASGGAAVRIRSTR